MSLNPHASKISKATMPIAQLANVVKYLDPQRPRVADQSTVMWNPVTSDWHPVDPVE